MFSICQLINWASDKESELHTQHWAWYAAHNSSSINKHSHLAAGAFLLVEGAWVPSLKPFLALLNTCFKYLILPVPWVFLLLALTDQLSILMMVITRVKILTSSLGGAGVTWRSASLLLSVPGLFTVDSAQGVGLVVTTTHGWSTLSLRKVGSVITSDLPFSSS